MGHHAVHDFGAAGRRRRRISWCPCRESLPGAADATRIVEVPSAIAGVLGNGAVACESRTLVRTESPPVRPRPVKQRPRVSRSQLRRLRSAPQRRWPADQIDLLVALNPTTRRQQRGKTERRIEESVILGDDAAPHAIRLPLAQATSGGATRRTSRTLGETDARHGACARWRIPIHPPGGFLGQGPIRGASIWVTSSRSAGEESSLSIGGALGPGRDKVTAAWVWVGR